MLRELRREAREQFDGSGQALFLDCDKSRVVASTEKRIKRFCRFCRLGPSVAFALASFEVGRTSFGSRLQIGTSLHERCIRE